MGIASLKLELESHVASGDGLPVRCIPKLELHHHHHHHHHDALMAGALQVSIASFRFAGSSNNDILVDSKVPSSNPYVSYGELCDISCR